MDKSEAFAFCELLFGHEVIAEEKLQIEVVSITPGKSGKLGYTFCKTTQGAADTALRIAEKNNNAYFCLSLMDPKTIKTKRGLATDSKGIVGLWADIDIADPMAPKPGKNPPVNIKEALAIAKGTGAAPSVIVHSGHGVHAYWLFDKPWIFEDDADRDFAADVAKGWQATINQVARDRGRTLDSVFDFARVLRIPGTVNTKNEAVPTEVNILWPPAGQLDRTKRYARGEMESLVRAPAEGQADDVVVAVKLKNVEFRLPNELERAQLGQRITFACMNDQTFKDTWERDRMDFASSQHSASEYDMSLANQMMAAGWSDQDIMWTLLFWREKHGEDTDKILKRTDYVELTLAKAKKGNVATTAAKSIADIAATVEHLQTAAPTVPEEQQAINDKIKDNRQKAFEEVSKLLGIQVTGFHCDGEGLATTFYLEIKSQRCLIGSVDDLFDFRRVCKHIFLNSRIVLGNVKQLDWMMAMRLLAAFRSEEINPSLTPAYRWLGYLTNYIDGAPSIPDLKNDATDEDKLTKQGALMRRKPFWQSFSQNGTTRKVLYFSLETLRNYVQKYCGDRAPTEDMIAAIRVLNGEPKHVHQSYKGKKIHRYLWAITEEDINKHDAHIKTSLKKLDVNTTTNVPSDDICSIENDA